VALRVRLGVGLLAGVAVVLMGSWVVLFARLLEADRVIAARVREDAMWAVFQADRHAAGLLHVVRESLISASSTRHDDVVVAYDVLYSRAMLLERGAFAIDLSTGTEVGKLSAARTGEVLALAPVFDALDPESPAYLDDLARLEPRIAALREGMAQLLLASNQAVSESRVAERRAREAIHDRLGWSAGLLVLAFLGIGALLAYQLRQLRRAHSRMALLQRRSRHQAMRAKAASAVKSTFLATMSHEIRTPLNAIIGSAELLGSAGLDTAQRQRVHTIRSAGQLLLDVINDILDYSKLDSRGLDLSPEPVDLPVIGHTIASTFADRAAAMNLQLVLGFDPCRIRTDPGRLRQVIVNLVGNALKFTREGKVQVDATLIGANRLRVAVHDTGTGIRREDQARLFRDFEQIDGSYARAHGGTGLGLAICKRIVEGMGGRIGVVSAPGKGSTFWFEIPVERLGAAGPATEVGVPAAATGKPALRPALRVLVVEDNPINRAVITDQLVQLGHRPAAVETGFAALDRLAQETFDVVLMDMQMPGISGPDTTRRLRATGCRLPVIGVTANASTEDRKTCEASGMTGFVAKPVTLARLAEALHDTTAATPAPPPAPTPNPQLDDLVTSLGAARVISLLDQFRDSLPDAEADLRRAVNARDDARIDAALHTLKGAALTLGLTGTGQKAQTLRPPGQLTEPLVQTLLNLAKQELTETRKTLTNNNMNAA
jgi:signal transduction histidine kinase/FixJ family two-component response regulator